MLGGKQRVEFRRRPTADTGGLMGHLLVTLTPASRAVLVTWQLHDVVLDHGEPLGQLPLSVAGAPTLQLADDARSASDDRGATPPTPSTTKNEDAKLTPQWSVPRATPGPAEPSYRAEPAS